MKALAFDDLCRVSLGSLAEGELAPAGDFPGSGLRRKDGSGVGFKGANPKHRVPKAITRQAFDSEYLQSRAQ